MDIAMRMQLALNVEDLEKAIDYYSAMFGVPLNKREPGYANFVVPDHNLKLVLFEAPGAERLNHVGFEVFSDAEVDRTAEHLKSVELLDEKQFVNVLGGFTAHGTLSLVLVEVLLLGLLFVILPFVVNFSFYWIHRLLHWPPLYRLAHAVH